MPNNLVSTNWLHESLRAPDIAVIDGSWYLPAQNRDGKAEYLARPYSGSCSFRHRRDQRPQLFLAAYDATT